MRGREERTATEARWSGRRLALCAALLSVAACAVVVLYARRPGPVVETLTTGIEHSQSPAVSPSPIYRNPQLPARDVDVEMAGDKIAEATVYLSRRQKSAALRALREAHSATRRAAEARMRERREAARNSLLLALRELEAVELAVERDSLPDARQRLITLNRRLDTIEQ